MPLKHDEVKLYSELFRSLEEREPILSAWRCHCDSPKLSLKGKVITMLADLKKKGTSYFTPLQSPKPGQVVIMLLRDSPASSGTLLPVIKKLNEKGKPAFLIVNRNTQHYLSLGWNYGYATINNMLCRVLSKKEMSNIEMLAEEYENKMREKSGSHRFDNAKEWIMMGLAAKGVSNKYFSSSCYLLTDSDYGAFEKGIFIGASAKRINSARLQHGYYDEKHFPVFSRLLFDWGPYFTRQAELYGHPAERSVSLGSPRFDQLEALKSIPKDAGFAQKCGVSGRPVVLAISNTHAYDLFHEHIDKYFESIGRLIDNKTYLLVRLHPAEADTSLYIKHLGAERTGKIIFINARENLYYFMNNCDVLYHTLSSTSMEGMLLDKPVLWEESPEKSAYMDPPLRGGGILVNSGNIVDAVNSVGPEGVERKKILEAQEEFLSISLVNRGHGADAIADYLLEKTSKEDP